MDAEGNEALGVAQRLIDALVRADPDSLIALLDDRVVLEVPFPLVEGKDTTGARTSTGPAVAAYVRDVKARTSKIRFDNVVWRTTNDGLALFQADGVISMPDGGFYNNHYLMMFEVRDAKVIRWREYLSPIIWARAAGVPLDSLPS